MTTTSNPARIACSVPHCAHTTAAAAIAPDAEWLCSDHWRLVDWRIKKLRSKIRRRLKRAGKPNLIRLDDWAWQRAKRQAIERAMGIAA